MNTTYRLTITEANTIRLSHIRETRVDHLGQVEGCDVGVAVTELDDLIRACQLPAAERIETRDLRGRGVTWGVARG